MEFVRTPAVGAALFSIVTACSSTNSTTGAGGANSETSAQKTTCVIAGIEYETKPLSEQPGTSPAAFPCPDGCNKCLCIDDGQLSQTTAVCPDCIPASDPPPGTVCEKRTVRARKPGTSSCCTYSSPCNVPAGLEECSDAGAP